VEAPVSTVLDPRSIEREIARIREQESNPYSSGVKTNLFTLVIFRKKNGHGEADPIAQSLQGLLGRRPARIITIDHVDSAETGVTVSGRCFPDRRNRGVCFEEVLIESGTDGRGEDSGAWAPLLIRDLPVFAWWPDSLDGSESSWQGPILQSASLIDKLIVDSSAGLAEESHSENRHAPAAAMRSLLSLKKKVGGSFFISDFAWRRSRVLRELTARAFDQPDTRPLLSQVQSVTLDGGSEADALLYFSWLSTRLGWLPVGPDTGVGQFRDRGGRKIRLVQATPGFPLAEGFRLRFSFEGQPQIELGCTRGGCVSNGSERGAYKFPTDGDILLEEVDSLNRDPVYQEALERAGQGAG
jgi:glucose-6-phosphate dehydrogenase assembly protein OpcA